MDLRTTTRPRRHAEQFRRIVGLLPSRPAGVPLKVVNVGPGLAIKYLGRLSATDMPLWDFFRRIETGLRRIPMPDSFYENYEAHELVAALAAVPFELTLLDINPKVLRVAGKSLAAVAPRTVAVDLGQADAPALRPLAGTFDVVVAYAVIARIPQRLADQAAKNIRSLLKPGGILLGGSEVVLPEWESVEGETGFYRRPLAPMAVAR